KLTVDRADPKRRPVDRESAQVGSGAGAARGESVEELTLPDLCAAVSEPLFRQAAVPELGSARSPTRLLERGYDAPAEREAARRRTTCPRNVSSWRARPPSPRSAPRPPRRTPTSVPPPRPPRAASPAGIPVRAGARPP